MSFCATINRMVENLVSEYLCTHLIVSLQEITSGKNGEVSKEMCGMSARSRYSPGEKLSPTPSMCAAWLENPDL